MGDTMRLVALLASGGAMAAMGLISLGLALARGRPAARPAPPNMSAAGVCIALGLLCVLIGASEMRTANQVQGGVTGTGRRAGAGEWRIGEAYVAELGPLGSYTAQGAMLPAIEANVNLAVGVGCGNGIVESVAIGWTRPPGPGVVGLFYLSIDGGPIRSSRWSDDEDDPEALDGPRFLKRLAESTRLAVEARELRDWPVLMSATFDGSALPATLERMACRIPR